MRVLFCLFVPLTFASGSAQEKKADPKKEAAPKVLYTVPLVIKPGEKQKLTLRGKNLGAVKEVKVSGTEGAKVKVLAARAAGVPNNYPAERIGDSEVELELELPKGARAGPVALTAANGGGDSNAYTLLLRDALPAVAEKEENGGFGTAQALPVPCAVEGTIKGERDVDAYKFEGKKGQKVRIEVQAARFGSPFDGLLTVCGPDRNVIDSADDVNGSADPVLALTLPKDGTYFITLIDANDLGGANFGYRLVVKPE